MPRLRRIVIPNCPHHVTQRGNNRRDVFFTDTDRQVYLSLLREYSKEYGVEIIGYCLMTNHVHAVAIPSSPTALAKAFGRTHNDYARWLHIRRHESGHLWQNRYFSCPVEARYLWAVLAYVERNPVRAGLVPHCEDWFWSSALTHLHPSTGVSWLHLESWTNDWSPAAWSVALEQGLAEAEIQSRLADATQSGRPFGAQSFIADIEKQTGLSLQKQKPGPNPKLTFSSSVPGQAPQLPN